MIIFVMFSIYQDNVSKALLRKKEIFYSNDYSFIFKFNNANIQIFTLILWIVRLTIN